jgi:hypothetical protein
MNREELVEIFDRYDVYETLANGEVAHVIFWHDIKHIANELFAKLQAENAELWKENAWQSFAELPEDEYYENVLVKLKNGYMVVCTIDEYKACYSLDNTRFEEHEIEKVKVIYDE